MNIIDNTCINHVLQNHLDIKGEYYMAPEVIEEAEFSQAQHNRQLPTQIYAIIRHEFFDEATYIDFYKKMLNKYEGKSFFNMTGLGDHSILATVHTILSARLKKEQKVLFEDSEIIVFTDDIGLSKKIAREFLNQPVSHKSFKDIN
jgi:hypothetical protein